MHSQLTRAPPKEEVNAIFLAALREPLRTMYTIIDFRTSIKVQVIGWVMEMDKKSSWPTTGALQRALPTDKDLRFQQPVSKPKIKDRVMEKGYKRTQEEMNEMLREEWLY